MIYSLRGPLIQADIGLAVIECGGVGYACRTTTNTLAKIRGISGDVILLTHLHITDNAIDLFGFADEAELTCFRQLLTVSGVGPKAALAILSDNTPSMLALCIATGDSKSLTKTPGIGVKIAQRIVLELKDQVAKNQHIGSGDLVSAAMPAGDNVSEALGALSALGFNPAQAGAALSGAPENASVEDLIKYALKNLG